MNELSQLAAKKTLRVAGLMSGTSADGVSAAIVTLGPRRVRVLASRSFHYPPALRRKIFKLFQPETARLDDICHLNFVLGEVFSDALIRLAAKSGIPLDSIDLVGSHGQTICHLPRGRRFGKKLLRSTLQIGEPSVIAERTGITTVADFRPRDVAAGGEGAPLVPYSDYILFRHPRRNRAIQNIGGIANVTWLPAYGGIEDVLAFDTGPGNMVLDRMAHVITRGRLSYDAGGRMAARGIVHAGLLSEWMAHPFLRRQPPKSTGREEFGAAFSDKTFRRARAQGIAPLDILATATAFTARTIAEAYRKFLTRLPDEVILCGGGAKNRTLARLLQCELEPARVRLMDEFGIGVEAKEAVSFAILAREAIRGVPGNVPSATGARRPVVLGKIVPGTPRILRGRTK